MCVCVVICLFVCLSVGIHFVSEGLYDFVCDCLFIHMHAGIHTCVCVCVCVCPCASILYQSGCMILCVTVCSSICMPAFIPMCVCVCPCASILYQSGCMILCVCVCVCLCVTVCSSICMPAFIPVCVSRRCVQVIHKLICYQKKCRIRLHYTWRELWSGKASWRPVIVTAPGRVEFCTRISAIQNNTWETNKPSRHGS